MFSIIIPTMWRSEKIKTMLPIYQKCRLVGEIIIIDNDTTRTFDLSKYSKVRYYPQEENIFVNPAWNLGASLAKYKIILANDDIIITELSKLLKLYLNTEYTVVGINLFSKEKKIVPINRFPANSWGSFLYLKKYLYIPEQIKIWRGDYLFFEKLNPASVGGFIETQKSETINSGDFRGMCKYDILEYSKLKTAAFNVIIRTSNRPNYFTNCYNSIKKNLPKARLHITVDDEKYLEYVKRIAPNENYYLVNRETIKNFCDKIDIERPQMVHNYYLNTVKPFLNGWCMVIDDDDMLLEEPQYDKDETNNFYINKVDVKYCTVPREANFGKQIVINDISMIGLVFHSSVMDDFSPQGAGDYQFALDMSKHCNVKWVDRLLSKTQNGTNKANRKDIKYSEIIIDKSEVISNEITEQMVNPYHKIEIRNIKFPIKIVYQFEDQNIERYYTKKCEMKKDIIFLTEMYK